MFLGFIQYIVALVYCMHGFALAFSLLVRRDALPELGLSVRSVSLWLLTFVLYTVLLTFICKSNRCIKLSFLSYLEWNYVSIYDFVGWLVIM